MRTLASLYCVFGAAAACATPVDDPPPTATSERPLNGMEGMFEFAIDLPWRMEPHIQPDGLRLYDPVPIVLSIHDEDTNPYSGDGRLYDLCKVEVSRYRSGQAVATTTFLPSQLEWMERTGRAFGGSPSQATYWPMPSEGLQPPTTTACHPSYQSCSGYERIYDTSEWHGLVKWDPGPTLPGYEETLQLVAYVSAAPGCGSRQIRLVNYARAHWAYDPLPRFGDERWLYGDLHYHSQSTDNEGESGYSYRAVTAAMGALGIDFAFATDHASDSSQIVDVDRLDWNDVLPERHRGLRDLNQARWSSAQDKLHGLLGANPEVAEYWPQDRRRIPRLFLGAEVDVTPEVGLAPTNLPPQPYWTLPFGNGRELDLFDWTTDGFISYAGAIPTLTAGDVPLVFQPFTDRNGLPAYMLGDVQGWNERKVGRQHMLYLPRFAEQPTGFVGSRTGTYGGATRHAVEPNSVGSGVLPEVAQKQGVAFLAHPLAGGGGGPGPGMAPYSDYQYSKLFEQQALAGLQLWNEDARVTSRGCFCGGISACACPDIGDYEATGYDWLGSTSGGSHMPGWEDGEYRFAPMFQLSLWGWQRLDFGVDYALHNGAYTWDRLLRWGLDQGRTEQLSWLPAGEPRRLFMAGGSDAHGDLNYRREGYMRAPEEINDAALAKVRNLVFAGHGRTGCRPTDWLCFDPVPTALQSTHEQPTVADALSEGRFSVTDGPAVRLVVDINRNGIIDDNDAPMGSVVELYNGEALPVLVEWHSTNEFGAVERVDLYVGVDSDPQCTGECTSPINESRARTYAPPDHGARLDADETNSRYYNGLIGPYRAPDPVALECAGTCRMQDGYWLPADATARQNLRYVPTTAERYRGTRALSFDLSKFPSSGPISSAPTRAYVRAFVRTRRQCDLKSPNTPTDVLFSGNCSPRYGFTNPVWALRKAWTPGQACPLTDRALDRDRDGAPDLCDLAPDTATLASWSRAAGGAGYDSADSVAFDGAGTAYVAVRTNGAGRIQRSQVGVTPFSSLDQDAHLLKYSAAGELLGRFHVMGSGPATITDVAVDFIGNVYVTGMFSGAAQVGNTPLSATDVDAFVAKLRGTDLSVMWLHRLGGAGYGRATSLALTNDGFVAVAGDYTGTLTTNLGTVTADGAADCFVLWLSNQTGNQAALQRLGGSGDCTATSVTTDGLSRVLMSATYSGTLQTPIGGQTSTSRDTVVLRLGSEAEKRAATWVTWLGVPSSSAYDVMGYGLASLSGGDVALVGAFQGSLGWASGAGAFTALGSSAGAKDAFMVRLGGATGAVTAPSGWRFGSTGDDALLGVGSDSSGRVLATGWFASSSLTTALGTLTRTGTSDGLALAFDSALTLRWQRDFGSAYSNSGAAAAISSDGRMALVGTFQSQAALDDRRALISAGDRDAVLAVYKAP